MTVAQPSWNQAIPHSCLPRAHFAKGCKNAKTAPLTTFRINTCKSVSKQRTLTLFRINTYEKQGRGYPSTSAPRSRERESPDWRSVPPSYAPRAASIPYALTRLRILPVTTGVYCPLEHSPLLRAGFPRPAFFQECALLQFGEGLAKLFLGVHHDGAVPGYRFFEGLARD